ncbi:MAG: hypothetical protein ACI4HQ_02205 [Acetatifactor sp.]
MKHDFSEALQGKKIPILTLDHKWYRLLDQKTRKALAGTEEQLNTLLKRQGRLNTEVREIKKIKKKLMNEIMEMADEAEQGGGGSIERQLEQHKRLVQDCNEKLDSYQDELMELPRQIEQLNLKLMTATMECCYSAMKDNTEEIEEIAAWVTGIRIELKKKLVKKQQLEQQNHEIYSYMHDVFGADVIDLFDMKYNPEEQHPVIPVKEAEEKK